MASYEEVHQAQNICQAMHLSCQGWGNSARWAVLRSATILGMLWQHFQIHLPRQLLWWTIGKLVFQRESPRKFERENRYRDIFLALSSGQCPHYCLAFIREQHIVQGAPGNNISGPQFQVAFLDDVLRWKSEFHVEGQLDEKECFISRREMVGFTAFH